MIHPKHSEVHPEYLELWKTDVFLRKIEPMLASTRLLSLDIFDTLLFRACSLPTDVYILAAEKAVKTGVLRPSIRPKEFRDIRIKAELQARDRFVGGEVTLEQIYAEIPASVCDGSRMLRIELETEQEVCYLNPNIASLLYWCKENHIQVALVSDMYLSSLQLSGILHGAGLDLARIDTLLVSSEQQCGKVSGGLFDRLFACFPHLICSDVLHIGDNEAADLHGAASRGIEALRYNVVPENFDSPFHWDYVRHGSILPELKSVRKLAGISRAEPDEDEEGQFFFSFGAAVLGPFLHGWCEWVIDECIRENRYEVHPLMREAYLLAPMLEEAARMRGVALNVKPLYVSRQATYLASLENYGAEALDRLLTINWVKIGDLFHMLDIAEESAYFHSYLDTPLVECSSTPDKSGRTTISGLLREFLLEDRIRRKVEASIERNRKLFVDYLFQECGSPESIITVDIGFNGTIQKAVETAMRLSDQPHRMIHLLAVGTEKVGTHLLAGMDVRCFLGSCGENSDISNRIARTPAFLEELMMGEFGSTLRYEVDPEGVIKPVLAELFSHSDRELRLKKACQEGAFAFQRYYDYLRKAKPKLLAAGSRQPREWSKTLHRVIDMPTPEEARLLGSLMHQENFCGVQISSICNPVEDRWFEQGEGAFLDFCNYGPSTFNAYWPQGMLTRKSPYYLYRHFLRLQDLFGNQSLIFELIRKVKEDGVSTVHIYGTGSFAESVRKNVLLRGLTVESFINPYAEQSDGAGSLDVFGTTKYVIASLSDISTFKQQIEQKYLNSGISPVIYDFFPG